MKQTLLVLLLSLCLLNTGCQACASFFKDIKSDTVGVHRVIRLMDCSGRVIQRWESNTTVTVEGGSATWIDDKTGKRITVSGTFVMEED